MKNFKRFFAFLFIAFLITACTANKQKNKEMIIQYVPEDKELYETVVAMDSIFFHAYNNCDLEKQFQTFSDEIEFFHDKGGLMTSKKDIIDATEKNICGKVRRELIKGTVEVYPIKDYGAVEIGYHKFYNNQEASGTPSKPGKFIIIWQKANDNWKISKVISLH